MNSWKQKRRTRQASGENGCATFEASDGLETFTGVRVKKTVRTERVVRDEPPVKKTMNPFESKIVDEVVAEMVQPAEVVEDRSLAIALFNSEGKHVFSIQRATDVETQALVLELREWLRSGMERVLERTEKSRELAKAAGN
jgi:hypothetical protein